MPYIQAVFSPPAFLLVNLLHEALHRDCRLNDSAEGSVSSLHYLLPSEGQCESSLFFSCSLGVPPFVAAA